ncbi:hypothetical protein QMO39_32025, partial [Pseudomonas aeruginosa]|nr:hypothetical protein [Pseudomonas aeruginosa]
WRIRAGAYLQPGISLLRGQGLERQSPFVDAAPTYHFIIARDPTREYAYRAKARLGTVRPLGRLHETWPLYTADAVDGRTREGGVADGSKAAPAA